MGNTGEARQIDGIHQGQWATVFLDNADQPGALAYHDLTADGLPLAKVFVKTTLANHDLVSVSASHELVEMPVDPAINLLATGPDPKTVYAYESADPVEALSYPVNGIPMTDFVYPSYFENFHKPGSVQFDRLKKVNRPFRFSRAAIRSSSRTANGVRSSARPRRGKASRRKTAAGTAASSASAAISCARIPRRSHAPSAKLSLLPAAGPHHALRSSRSFRNTVR